MKRIVNWLGQTMEFEENLSSAIAKHEITNFPVFIKPDKGQGSVGARKINSPEELKNIDITNFLIMEYLPGKEYTVDCFTNAEGKLIYAKGRSRKRIKSGISVNAVSR